MASDRLSDKLTKLVAPWRLDALTDGIDVKSLWRWARLSVVVGVVVGLGAAGAFYILEWAESWMYSIVGRHHAAAGETERIWWLALLLPAAGGLVAGWLVTTFAREAKGHGTDAMIDAYHHREAVIRPRVPFVKLLASLFTLGTGGSAGREGPMAQIGAGFGSFLAQLLRLSVRERRLLLLAGAAGAISALFRAPLGAALWALEVLYRDDFESEGIFPCLISSVTAYSVFVAIFGAGSLFDVPVVYQFRPVQLVFYAALGLALTPFGVLWIKMFYGTERAFTRLTIPPALKPALGGLLLGGLALGVPWVFGGGYGWMQDALRPLADPNRQLPIGYTGFGLLLGIGVAKMLATSLTVGSGGSGGVFAPSLFIGGFLGGAFGLVFHQWAPGVIDQPGAFVLVGMGAFYAGIGRVPISAIILISEMFGSYELLVPLMATEMITVLSLRRFTLYEKQVADALDSPAHVTEVAVDILQHLRVADHCTHDVGQTVPASLNFREFLALCARSHDSSFVVRDDRNGKLVGVASLAAIRSVISDQDVLDAFVVGDAMTPLVSVAPDTDLRQVLNRFVDSGYEILPVLDPERPNEVAGTISFRQVLNAYHTELLRRRLEDDDHTGLLSSGIHPPVK